MRAVLTDLRIASAAVAPIRRSVIMAGSQIDYVAGGSVVVTNLGDGAGASGLNFSRPANSQFFSLLFYP